MLTFGQDSIVYYSNSPGTLDNTEHSTILGGDRVVGSLVFGQAGLTYGTTSNIYIQQAAAETLTLQTSAGMPVIDIQANRVWIMPNIAGNQGLYKTGPGRLNLHTTAKSYTGTTQVNRGCPTDR